MLAVSENKFVIPDLVGFKFMVCDDQSGECDVRLIISIHELALTSQGHPKAQLLCLRSTSSTSNKTELHNASRCLACGTGHCVMTQHDNVSLHSVELGLEMSTEGILSR